MLLLKLSLLLFFILDLHFFSIVCFLDRANHIFPDCISCMLTTLTTWTPWTAWANATTWIPLTNRTTRTIWTSDNPDSLS